MERTLRLALLAVLCAAVGHCIQNIDVQQPILRSAPGELNSEGYFGYSLVFHQKSVSSEFTQSLANTYLIVGAPNGTYSSSVEKNTGFVFECPIAQNGQCTRIPALSDDSADGNRENKEGQFMGGAIASNGDRLIACAHRYVNYQQSDENVRSVFGRCYHSGRDLTNFEEFQPCSSVGRRSTQSFGVCQAGMSAAVAQTSDGTSHIAVGAPGTYLWRGIVIRRNPSQNFNSYQPYELNNENAFGWQGYSLITGHFRDTNIDDFATSVPRLNSYSGGVHILRNDIANPLRMVSQNLVGDQMGEYYGFSLVALNLGGSSLDELIVSAPMYRDRNIGAETGRIYIYQNIGGTLSEVSRIVGFKAYSRFGHAMVSLGDITGDGFDDVAVSAPFSLEVDGPIGAVYIYHSSASQFLTSMPQQTITPSSLNLLTNLIESITSFGTSLASLDVDANNFRDLAIGSYRDQSAVILRTRPLAQVTTTFSASPGIIDLEAAGQKRMYDGKSLTFFQITLSVEFNGQGSIDLDIAVVAERTRKAQGLEQRLFFEASPTTLRPDTQTEAITLGQGDRREFTYTVFVEDGIADILNGFVLELELSAGDFVVPTRINGNVAPTDLNNFPVVGISGPSTLQVEIQTDCDSPCISDLVLTTNGPVQYIGGRDANQLTVGEVTQVIVPLTIANNGNNAFLGQLIVNLPIQFLVFGSISDPVITCSPGNGNGQIIPYICDLENPFEMDESRDVSFTFMPASSLTGEEGNILLNFNSTSLNENADTVNDNALAVTLQVNTVADIFVDEGIAFPDQVNHSPERLTGTIANVTALGPAFTTTFTIGNNGPSVIPNSKLTIFWPLNLTRSDNLYFLYPTGWRTIQSTSVSVSCEGAYFNPEDFDVALADDDENNQGGTPDSRGKRRKRSVGGYKPRRRSSGRNTRMPRQDMAEIPMSAERTVSCLPEDRNNANNNHSCVAIVCEVRQLRAGNRVQIEISAVIDNRNLGGNIDSFTFIPSATVETVGAGHITEQNMTNNAASARFRSIPGMVVINVEGASGDDESVPWYAIAIPIIVAVILIIIVAVVLYFCGFFRRKNKDEIEDQARENLAEENTTM